jgi:tetratricopeptide (TPR) repeat protein
MTAFTIDTTTYQLLIEQGIAAMKGGDKARAFEVLTHALRFDPNHEQAWLWLSGAVIADAERRYCLEQVLTVNPQNSAARRGLTLIASNISPRSPLPEPLSESTTAQKTPSRDQNDAVVAHSVQASVIARDVQEQRDLDRYLELCSISLAANNYPEAVDYANRVLEIDPRNVEAWISKAIATFWLTTAIHNRYDEAISYLQRASEIDLSNDQIDKTYKYLKHLQASWYNKLGNDQFKHGWEIHNIFDHGGIVATWKAESESTEIFLKAMTYYLAAAQYEPERVQILENIANCASRCHWITWNDEVSHRISTLQKLRAKQKAETKIAELVRERNKLQSELDGLRGQKGFFVEGKVKKLERRLDKLDTEAAKLQADASYAVIR